MQLNKNNKFLLLIISLNVIFFLLILIAFFTKLKPFENSILNNEIPYYLNILMQITQSFGFLFFLSLSCLIVYILRNNPYLKTINMIVALIIVISSYFWLILVSYFITPDTEGFYVIFRIMNIGLFNDIKILSLLSDSRYFTNILHGINPFIFGGISWYKTIPTISLCLLTFSLSFVIKAILGNYVNFIKAILIASFIIILHFSMIPGIYRDLFCMTSSFVFLYAWISYFLWVGFFFKLINTINLNIKIIYFFLSIIFLVATYGINEMMLLINSMTLLILWLYFLFYKRKSISDLIPFFIISFFCFLLIFKMPGLTGKDEDIALKRNFHEYISIFSTGSKHFFYTYFNWLFLNKITFAFILLSIVLMYPFSKNNFIKSINKTHILFILLILFTASLIIVLTFYSIRNVNLYPNRIYNFINWIFIALTLAIIPIFIHKINFISNNFIQKYKHQLLMFFLFYIFFQINLSTNNFTIIRNDFISKKLSSFNDRITKRYNTYIYPESIGQWKIIYTDTLLLIPDIYIDFLYITPNKKEKWDNDYAAYFKADEIMLQGDTISNKNEIKKKLNELSAQR